MKKFIIALTIALSISTASATDWIFVGENKDSTNYHFADVDSIKTSGMIVNMWMAQNLYGDKEPIKTLNQFNCKTDQVRILYMSGESNTTPTSWLPIAPGSIFSVEELFACDVNKRKILTKAYKEDQKIARSIIASEPK